MRADHCSNIFGVSNNLHVAKFFALQIVDVPWANRFLEPSENRVKSHCKQKAARRTALSCSSCHQELSSFCSRKLYMCNAVLIYVSWEALEKIRQTSMFKDRENPGVIDTGIRSSNVG